MDAAMRGYIAALHIFAWSFAHQVRGQEYSFTEVDYVIHGHITTFPSDIPEDVTKITIESQLNSFPEDAFEKFHQLDTLDLDYNHITELPNLIPVGETLKSLSLVNCRLTTLNDTVYDNLRALESLFLRLNPLVSFPDVHNGPKATLRLINIEGTHLTSFPALADYQKLYYIILASTDIAEAVTEADIRGPALKRLLLDSSDFTSLPEAPKLTESFTELSVKSTTVRLAHALACLVFCLFYVISVFVCFFCVVMLCLVAV
jgi:Leucine-rich repeat (LRR) protein